MTANAGAMWRQFLPITLGALLLLQLFQRQLVWSTARRLDASPREREGLLRRAVEATDTERRRIARDLHDGVVQDLAAANYSLVGAKSQAAAKGHKEGADALDGGAQALRRGIRSLRTLLVEIYPPSLHRAGLPAALRDLLDPLTGRGIEVRLQVPDSVELGDDRAELVFRVAQEAVRNVAEHSAAGGVDVELEVAGGTVALTVADDGIGFDPARLADTRPAATSACCSSRTWPGRPAAACGSTPARAGGPPSAWRSRQRDPGPAGRRPPAGPSPAWAGSRPPGACSPTIPACRWWC